MSTDKVDAAQAEAADAPEEGENTGPAGEGEAPPPPAAAPSPSRRQRRDELLRRSPDLLVVLAVSVAFGLSFGLNYGVDNQTAYMLGSLRKLDPTVLGNDWYASGAANYHPAFSYVGWLLLALDRGGYWVGVALVAVAAAGSMFVYWLAAELFERRRALATFLLTMTILFLTRTKSVAVSYIFDFILQPSTLGSLFLLAALAPFVAGRFLLSGILLGLSGLFHANFLLLGMATFGLTHLALGRKDLVRRLLQQVGPSVVVFLLLSPLIFRSVGSPDAARAQDILFNIRSPHHYAPRTFKSGFFQCAAWLMLGLGAGAWLLRGLEGRGKRLGALILGFAVVIWGGTLLTTWVSIDRVAQLFVWRFAPFLDLLMALLFSAAAVHVAARPGLARRVSPAGLTLAFAGLVSLGMLYEGKNSDAASMGPMLLLAAGPAILGVLIAGLGQLAARRRISLGRAPALLGRHGAWAVVLAALLVCGAVSIPHARAYRSRSNVINGLAGPESDMYAWIRANTPKDATFLTPPQLERFRLAGERPIVVDWKGSAYVPSELIEWYKRLEEVSGRRNWRKLDELTDGYGALDRARVEALARKYNLQYVVVTRGREQGLPGKVVYQNSRFMVLALGG